MNSKANGASFGEKFARIIFIMSTATSIVALGFIIYFLFSTAIPTIAEIGFTNFIFGKEWRPSWNPPQYGILPFIVGSIYATSGAILIGVPIGLLVAVYMAYYAPKKIYGVLKAGVNLLAGIPSVVYGLFTLTVIVPLIRKIPVRGNNGLSLFAAIIVLAVMILPTIISLSESALRAVPKVYYDGSIGLGASKERTIFTVMIPAAKSGILSSIILGIGRAIGETMAVAMVAGNQPIIPTGIFQGVRTMTINIVLEMKYASQQHENALIATGAVLFVFILLINVVFNLIKNRKGTKND